MAILNNNQLVGASGNQGYNINNSLRFRSSASAYLNRTPASAGNRQTWTWSAWIKRGVISVSNPFFNAGNNASNRLTFSFDALDRLILNSVTSGTNTNLFTTTPVYRDPSAWYHIVLAFDTTQATASNRVKLYVNNLEVTVFTIDNRTSITQNSDSYVNDNVIHYFGTNTSTYFDGYLSELNLIDGQALTPSSFGETDAITGVWKPKAYAGTYGTNGFYLKFSDIATTSGSNAGLGRDFSGNGNFWNTNNISVTSGTTYDAMTDSPTNTSATVANYCVLNPLQTSSLATVTDANLTVKGNSASNSGASVATMQVPTGLYYAEFTITGSNAEYPVIGVVNTDTLLSNSTLLLYGNPGYYSGVGYRADGQKIIVSTSSYGSSFTTNDVIGIAVDTTNGAVYFSKNNTWQNSGVPTSGASKTGAAYTYTAGSISLIMSVAPYNTSSGVNANFGQRPFAYTPPTGFVRLNTFNLPTSTIVKGNTVMDATLYTGTGAAQTITNASAFSPDLVWIKGRSGATDHALYDTVRGTTLDLVSNSTAAETTQAQGVTAFNSNGFSIGTLAKLNTNTATYVSWQWDAGSSTVTNTSGSISSQVRANTTAGFSVVTFTSQASGTGTVGHGLGIKPSLIITKLRTLSANWRSYHSSLGATKDVRLNLTDAALTTNTSWADTEPTSTVFTVGSSFAGSYTTVAYCWAEIAGFSKFGSYTGNASTDGPFVYTGFRPKYVLVKRTDTAGYSWIVLDSARSTYNVASARLIPNTADAEASGTHLEDFLSNGFKLRGTSLETNGSGGTYIYAAFAENPFKNANAR